MRRRRGGDRARRGARLIVGPWSHSDRQRRSSRSATTAASSCLGNEDPTGSAPPVLRPLAARRRRGGRAPTTPPVRLFLMGADRWQHETDWPPPDAEIRTWYLRGDGRANTARGDGRSRPSRRRAEEPDAFLYDPRDPVPTMGGATLNQSGTLGWNSRPVGPAAARGRADVLVYTSAPLERPLDRHRPRRGRPLRLVVGPRHGLHREARRRPPVGSGRDPRRRHPARCATGGRCRTRSRSSPAASRRSASRSAGPRTCSWPATGSGSTSRAATSPGSTRTRTPAARSPTRVTTRPCRR